MDAGGRESWRFDARDAEVIPADLTKTKRLKNENGKMQNANCIFLNGDALMLPVSDMSADVVSIAFGIRNVSDPAAFRSQFAFR